MSLVPVTFLIYRNVFPDRQHFSTQRHSIRARSRFSVDFPGSRCQLKAAHFGLLIAVPLKITDTINDDLEPEHSCTNAANHARPRANIRVWNVRAGYARIPVDTQDDGVWCWGYCGDVTDPGFRGQIEIPTLGRTIVKHRPNVDSRFGSARLKTTTETTRKYYEFFWTLS